MEWDVEIRESIYRSMIIEDFDVILAIILSIREGNNTLQNLFIVMQVTAVALSITM